MKNSKYIWIIGLVITILIIVIPIVSVVADSPQVDPSDPWSYVPQRAPHVDHTSLIEGPFETGSDVTRRCLECHEDAGHEMLDSVHWTWEGDPVLLPGRDEPVTIGKKNQINNFCIGIQGNWTGCTRCHAGYGWDSADFDFSEEDNIDCLVCHDQTGAYVKSNSGLPADGVDLVASAQSVGVPTRQNCGGCHFNGGGGNAVKHGDLDSSLFFPTENVDVHMGRFDFQCVDCHQTENHQIKGHLISVSPNDDNLLACTDCHEGVIHEDSRINAHLDAVACQTCHVPQGAIRDATKVDWDWSTAGQDIPEDPHIYLKIKGSFVYEKNITPDYAWFNGNADRYILGDVIDPTQVTVINQPLGSVDDPTAKIWPFKIHTARQIYDTQYNWLIQPKTVGEGGYWTEFDWDLAARLGMETVGLPYSGEYGFTQTEMYWPLTHLVQPKEHALQCSDCHGENGRMNWESLGYYGDPIRWGGRTAFLESVVPNMEEK
ncbi:MAG: tetrathionate reductase family octaheme c-type cytochrome [Ardenticatenaceae bacterium]|nr:tetrathionate reductase family octaheme c-type cytochrome [Anaerolineales bacterium]MCB8923392.1 tetrathionate reductase family octaheme c-type cytochrome [Ardenticatenaceae bacterium]